ncbi:MAG: phosphatidylglycerol lysyltransferase domain-containing protein [Candidatus Limnocylindrales bacterium]
MIAPFGYFVAPLPALFLASAALTAFACALLAGRGFERITALVPIDVTDADPLFGALSGIGLVALAVGLHRRKRLAWWFAVATLTGGLFGQAVALDHPVGIVLIGGVLGVLLADRRRYRVESGIAWARVAGGLLVVAAVAVLAETLLFIASTGEWPGPLSALAHATSSLASSLGMSDAMGDRVLHLASRGGLLAVLLFAARLPVVLAAIGVLAAVPEPEPDAAVRTRAEAIAARYGHGALLPFQLGHDKLVFEPAGIEGLIVYGLAGRMAVILGDPIGPPGALPRLLAAFVEQCARLDRVPVVYQASGLGRVLLLRAGFEVLRVGHEAVVDLASFDLAGARMRNLRQTVTRAQRGGVKVDWYGTGLPPGSNGLAEQLRRVDRAWRRRAWPPLGFTISCLAKTDLSRVPIAVALDASGEAVAFATFAPTGTDGGWVVDLIERAPDGPPGALEACLVEGARTFRSAGATTLSIGLAPLAGLDAEGCSWRERALGRSARLVRRWYNVPGLAFFKAKFDPRWEPRYVAARSDRDLVGLIVALVRLHVTAGAARRKGGSSASGRLSSQRLFPPTRSEHRAPRSTHRLLADPALSAMHTGHSMDKPANGPYAALPATRPLVAPSEMAPGLVLHLDPEELERRGGMYSCPRAFRVEGGHFFVCLSVSGVMATWLPLYSRDGPGRTLLVGSRTGHPKWTHATTYYHSGQVWTADAAAIAAAALAGGDLSTPASRSMLEPADLPVGLGEPTDVQRA